MVDVLSGEGDKGQFWHRVSKFTYVCISGLLRTKVTVLEVPGNVINYLAAPQLNILSQLIVWQSQGEL